MKRRFLALVLAGCLAAVLSTAAWASETPTSVSTESELTTALGDTAVTSIQLKGNIDISNTLVVTKDVTLDLNGFVLQHENRDANDSVIKIESGTLTLVDSNPDAIHKFVKEATGLWTLNENAGTEIVKGGVITCLLYTSFRAMMEETLYAPGCRKHTEHGGLGGIVPEQLRQVQARQMCIRDRYRKKPYFRHHAMVQK